MSDKASTDSAETVNLAERERLLRAVPLFTDLAPGEIAYLVSLLQETYVNPGEKIVSEGDLVDSVYILADGRAEVTQHITVEGSSGETLLATLNQGETIGLSETGIFTATGTRTATVTAVTSALLLKLTLTDLDTFLKAHPETQKTLRQSTEWMVRMNFIKKAAPFAQFTPERIAWLAALVKEINIDAGTVIFKQDDPADSCYLIQQGEVEIRIRHAENEQEKTAAILHAPQLFGEGALLAAIKRNATAVARTSCRVLMLNHEVLSELTQRDNEKAHPLITLVMERTKPRRTEHIIYHQHKTADGQLRVTLKNPTKGAYFQLNEETWFLWQQLDGKKSLQEITLAFHKEFNRFNPEDVTQTIDALAEAGFVHFESDNVLYRPKKAGPPTILERILNARFIVRKPDRAFQFLYDYGLWLVFTRPAMMLLILFSCGGFALFLMVTEKVTRFLPQLTELPLWLFSVVFFSFCLKLSHPLMQAFTVKHFKHEVHRFALGWRLIVPVAFVDLSDMWLSSRWPRSAVYLAGVISDCVIAALLSCYAFYTNDNAAALFAWGCALFIYLMLLRNLDPLLNSEGYELLTCAFNLPDLQTAAFCAPPRRPFKNWLKMYPAQAGYWLYCLAFLIGLVLTTIWLQNHLLAGLMRGHIYLYGIAPALAAIAYITSLEWEIHGARREHKRTGLNA